MRVGFLPRPPAGYGFADQDRRRIDSGVVERVKVPSKSAMNK